jgi:hypothetical protein
LAGQSKFGAITKEDRPMDAVKSSGSHAFAQVAASGRSGKV